MILTKKIVTVIIALVIILSGGSFSGTAEEEIIVENIVENAETIEEVQEEVIEGLQGEEEKKIEDVEEEEILELDEKIPWTTYDKEMVKAIIDRGYNGTVLEDRNAILKFQAENNLLVDGIVGDMTKEALTREYKVVYDIVPESFWEKEWIIVVNKSKKILTVYKNGEVYKKYPVALGKESSPTPDYKFRIINKIVDPYWGGMGGKYKPVKGGDPKNPLGRRWLGLSTEKYWGYGIHGNSDPFSIGKYMSAGCIRMINEDVEELFEYIPVNTEVWVGTEEVLESWGIKQCIEYKVLQVAYNNFLN